MQTMTVSTLTPKRQVCPLTVEPDDNVHSHCFLPLFPFQYGNLTLPEDTAVGSIILTIQATDADEPHTGSSKILYRIIQGDSDGRLEVETDLQTNAGYVKVKKVKKFFVD